MCTVGGEVLLFAVFLMPWALDRTKLAVMYEIPKRELVFQHLYIALIEYIYDNAALVERRRSSHDEFG